MSGNRLNQKLKIAVGLSGGVDSSVAAALLKKEGHDVIGVHMLNSDVDQPGCSGSEDRAYALRVAKQLEIPFRVVDFRKEYREKVIDRFVKEYQQGRTPNPDIWCNEFIKFGMFLDYAVGELGVDKIATGHYARVREWRIENGDKELQKLCYQLLIGTDHKKDQSYFLYRLTQAQLSKTIFPLGEYTKDQVRKMAAKLKMPTAQRPDSVGICFVGDIDVKEFLRERIKFHPGEVVDTSGKVIGRHEGVQLYTIGQRHGLELTDYQGEPLYVIEKDVDGNQLVVGRDRESEVGEFLIGDLHFINNQYENYNHQINFNNQTKMSELRVRIRHLGELLPCQLEFLRGQPVTARCLLSAATHGVASGQHAVFYQEDQVLGGGVIDTLRYNETRAHVNN